MTNNVLNMPKTADDSERPGETKLVNIDVDQPGHVLSYLALAEGKFRTPWHKHAGRHQILFTQSGALATVLDDERALLPARHGCIIPADMIHQLRSDSNDMALRTIYVPVSEDDPPAFTSFSTFPIPKLGQLLIESLEDWSESTDLAKQSMTLLRSLTIDWSSKLLKIRLPVSEDKRIVSVQNWILDNIGEHLSISDVAGRFGYSERTLIRRFKHELGMSFGHFKKVARITRAVALLSRSDVNINEVMYDVGYASPSSFSQCFKQLMSMTPSEYIKSQRH